MGIVSQQKWTSLKKLRQCAEFAVTHDWTPVHEKARKEILCIEEAIYKDLADATAIFQSTRGFPIWQLSSKSISSFFRIVSRAFPQHQANCVSAS
ncbi:hypothetical protein PHISCL_06582 [Aspergillus sclerotialis]|uniref:Uncharacterized protein n=1 Tax=Aspergillus sclerotialis TaxID=2070753 RepID=A0A3A2ZD53_9EURO|nr:hypothetical protein PHISCL_06582 [Aspergillus sclerotialis]